MSFWKWNRNAAPGTPAANKATEWFDTTLKRKRLIDETGAIRDIEPVGSQDENLLINGGFQIAQRQDPTVLTSYAAGGGNRVPVGADRWTGAVQTSSLQYQRVNTAVVSQAYEANLSARFYGQFKQITGAGKFVMCQIVENTTGNHLRSHQVRFQLKMKASSAKTIRIGVFQWDISGTPDAVPGVTFVQAFGADTVDPTWVGHVLAVAPASLIQDTAAVQAIRGSFIDCSVTAAWQLFGGLFTLPSDFHNVIVVFFTDAQFAVNDILNVSEAGLYDKVGPTDWVERPFEDTLAKCQRFFSKTFAVDTKPAQNAGVAGALRDMVAIAGAVATSSVMQWRFPVQMRTSASAPFLTFYNPSALNAFARNVPAATDGTVTAQANVTGEASDINVTGLAAWTVGQELKVHASAEAEI